MPQKRQWWEFSPSVNWYKYRCPCPTGLWMFLLREENIPVFFKSWDSATGWKLGAWKKRGEIICHLATKKRGGAVYWARKTHGQNFGSQVPGSPFNSLSSFSSLPLFPSLVLCSSCGSIVSEFPSLPSVLSLGSNISGFSGLSFLGSWVSLWVYHSWVLSSLRFHLWVLGPPFSSMSGFPNLPSIWSGVSMKPWPRKMHIITDS